MNFINDDVVISGIGGAFPKSENLAELKEHLFNNDDLMDSRWKAGERGVTNQIGKITVDYFDHAYFGIHRHQSFYMDPMQRLALEKTFEALLDAGVNPTEIKGKRIGVFMGSSLGENDSLFYESVGSGFGVTGHCRAMMPNRISYWLNLKGPSVAYDANWVSGLEVIRQGYDAIRTGQCEAAIVGTANLVLNSEVQWNYNDLGVLSTVGITKSFDMDADGYTRSDGIVVLYLQRASMAKRIYASIVNVDTCFSVSGNNKLTDPSSKDMIQFFQRFYEESEVKPEEVDFVEACGCGLKEVDKKELEALDNIYCKNRKSPLLVGSIKSNTGHSEASASMFSVAKVLIAMEEEMIPANIHYDKPNTEIEPIASGRIEVVNENRPWKGTYAAINSIGLDTYYGHMLLKSNPKKPIKIEDSLPRLAIASTRTEDGIKKFLDSIRSKHKDNPQFFQLIQDLYEKPILGHLYRGYTIVGGEDGKKEFEYHSGKKRQIWFVYSGMGSQWTGMVGDLMTLPVFADAINKCTNVLKPKGVDLLDIISSKDSHVYDSILHSFVGIAAIQIGLTDILKSIGIVPHGIIGHSVGELGCAYADGCLTAEQMILSAYSRGRASLEANLIKGMMAAIGMGYQEIKDEVPASIEVACHNGPDSSTISGPTEDMETFVKQLQDKGVFARLVNVSNIAYHSQYIKPAAPLLLKYLQEVIPEPVTRSSKWVSTSTLEEDWETDLAKNSSAEYHTNNLLSSVLFEEGLKHIPKDSVLIEIAPHGLLQAILKRSLMSGCTNISLTNRGCKSSVEFLLASLGRMYLAGLDLNVSALYPKLEYPVSKGTSTLSDLSYWNHEESWRTGIEGKQFSLNLGLRDIPITLNSEQFRDCVGHQFDDRIILPTSFYLNIVFEIFLNIQVNHSNMIFENIFIRNVLQIPKIGSVPLHVMVRKGTGEFEIVSNKELIMTGKISIPEKNDKFLLDTDEIEIGKDNVQLSGNDFYNEMHHRGHNYSGLFKTIKNLIITENGSVSSIYWNLKWHLFLEAMIQQVLLQAGERKQEGQTPKFIKKIAISQTLLPAEKDDVQVTYNFSTGIISTPGIQLIGLRTTTLEKSKNSNYLNCLDFIPLNNITYNSIESGINTALQLTLNNFVDQYVTSVIVTEIESKNPSLLNNVNEVLKEYKKLNSNVVSVKDSKQIIIQDSYPLLIIFNDHITPVVAKLVESCHGFFLVQTNKNILFHSDIVQVAQFYIGDISYSVIRRAHHVEPAIILAKTDSLSVKDLYRGSASWVHELKSAAAVANDKRQSIYLISNVIPIEGFANFQQELRELPDMQNVRVLFTLDNKSSEFNPHEHSTKILFKQNLFQTIIKDGVVGCYLSIPLKLKDNVPNNFCMTSDVIKNVNLKYIGINLKDETINPQFPKRNELGNIDYSGFDAAGKNIMGLARFDPNTSTLVADPILKWNMPTKWSVEYSAGVPNAYVCAYYALFLKANIKSGDVVLVHAGCSAIGSAAISLAFAHRCHVFTTVATNMQRAHIKNSFPFLNDNNILSSESTSFGPILLQATNGKGANVILNCLSGNLLQISLSTLAFNGRFLQYGKYDLEENKSIGMNVFQRNTDFYTVDFDAIMHLPDDVKTKIKDGIVEAIIDSRVTPLDSKFVDHQNISEILCTLKSSKNIGKIIIEVSDSVTLNKFNVDKPSQFICNRKSSYLICGGNVEYWADVTEWLVLRGARKIVISSDLKPQQNHINRRLSLLQTYYGAEIILAPNKIHTREGATELLSEVCLLGPIQGVFILPTKPTLSRNTDIKSVHYIDQALRTTAPKALLVNFISSAAGICYMRSEAGFNTYNVQWLKDLGFVDGVGCLDEILSYKIKNIFIKDDRDHVYKQSTQALYKKLNNLIPASPEVIITQIKEAPKEPKLIQLTTYGPREIRELIPMFIIPSLTGKDQIEDLAKDIIYPTFCAVLPSTSLSIEELALAYKIRNIWPQGPYNLVGVAWGGALTIEIARHLNRLNASTHIYFIGGAPNTLQMAVKHLGEDQTSSEVNLLSRIFSISDIDLIKKLKQAQEWSIRVALVLDDCKLTHYDKKKLEIGLSVLRKRLEDLSAFQPNDELVTGKIYLIRPSESSKYDNCGLTSYCKSTPEIVLVQDHFSIISSEETAQFINRTYNMI